MLILKALHINDKIEAQIQVLQMFKTFKDPSPRPIFHQASTGLPTYPTTQFTSYPVDSYDLLTHSKQYELYPTLTTFRESLTTAYPNHQPSNTRHIISRTSSNDTLQSFISNLSADLNKSGLLDL